MIGLHDIERLMRAWRKDVAELGYWIAPPAQGRGYVTEAARALMNAGYTTAVLHR